MDNSISEEFINEVFDAEWEPTVSIDTDQPEIDFDVPIKGKYDAEIKSIEYKKGTSKKTGNDYELIGLKMKITKDLEGDTSFGRYVDKTYFLGKSEWNDDHLAGYKRLLNDLASSNLYAPWMKTADVKTAVEKMSVAIVGNTVFLNMWAKKKEDCEGNITMVQEVRIKQPKVGGQTTAETPVNRFKPEVEI